MKKFLYSFLILLLGSVSLPAEEEKTNEVKPVVVIGSGVGALTSAVYLQRAGVQTIVLEGQNPGGAIAQSPNVQNWPGELDISGEALIEKIRAQAISNGAKIVSSEVTSVDFSKRPLTIHTQDVYDHEKKETIEAKSVIIAMGSMPKLLGVPGESGDGGYWTRGVYSCAVCDGSLYKGKTVAVVGGGDSAVLEADYLSKIAKKVYIVLRSDNFRSIETNRKDELIKKDNVEVIYNTQINKIEGNGTKVTHLNLSTEKKLDVDGVFVAIGANPNSQIVHNQIELDEMGYIKLKDGQETSVPGVFAIGDVVDPYYKQAISAAGDGAKAALQAERFLSAGEHKVPKPKTVVAEQNSIMELEQGDNFYEEIGKDNLPLLAEFYSPLCGPCKKLKPELEKAADDYQGKVRIIQIDVTKFSDLAENYEVYGVPSVLLFDGQGKLTKRASGYDQVGSMLKNLGSSIK